MIEQFYADPTVVLIGQRFSTDFRFLRKAIETPLVTYLQAGPTMRIEYVNSNLSNPKVWAYKCGPYELRNTIAANTSPWPINSAVAVAL